MKLGLLVVIVMMAFASNSILGRVGVFNYGMDPMAFSLVRVASGAAMLAGLVLLQGRSVALKGLDRFWGAFALTIYMVGFSWAYIRLDAGLGALILFGVMQVAMFGFAVVRKDVIPILRWIGAVIALAGLCVLLWPTGGGAIHIPSAVAMSIAGLAWAAYTLLGQGSRDPLTSSASNFVICLPMIAVFWGLSGFNGFTTGGSIAAVVSGAITSGLGYALWYRVVPQLPTTVSAVAQMSVPVIAVCAGVLLLGEVLTLRLVVAGALVLGGIGLSIMKRS